MIAATRVACALMVLGIAACATLSQYGFERPTVDLAAIEITGLGIQGGALDLLLDVHNPNSYDLRATRISVGIFLEGTHFGDAALTQAPRFPAGETTRLKIPLTFSWSGVGSGGRGLLARGAVQYRLDSRFELDTPIGPRGVDVSGEGQVTVRDLVGR